MLKYLTAVFATCVHVSKIGRTVVIQYFDSVSSLIVTLCLSLVVNEVKGKGKVAPLQAGVTQRVGRGIALLFHDRGTRRR